MEHYLMPCLWSYGFWPACQWRGGDGIDESMWNAAVFAAWQKWGGGKESGSQLINQVVAKAMFH